MGQEDIIQIQLIQWCELQSCKYPMLKDIHHSPNGGNYVIINSSGGTVYDVWKSEGKLVSSINGSDGWEFVDSKGNLIRVGGDSLVIRCNDQETWDRYEEYHWSNTGEDIQE